MIEQPNGIVLVTGPTGSGKTTTLYSTLKTLATPEVNVCTIEDPIEMIEPAFNQMQVQQAIDLGFADGVRALMRQDPDIIMVGEIRDLRHRRDGDPGGAHRPPGALDAAHQRRAERGHAACSTWASRPTCSSSTHHRSVMAQRLVRTLCPVARRRCPSTARTSVARGTSMCAPFKAEPRRRMSTGRWAASNAATPGYLGRLGVYEIMQMTRDVKRLITDQTDMAALTQAAYKNGMCVR